MENFLKKAIVFGANGLVGSSVVSILNNSEKVQKVIPSTRKDVNLFSFSETNNFIKKEEPNLVVIAAAKVGGIYANNTYRSDFLLENLKINMNILESLIEFPNCKIINLGSSCIYPLNAENPIKEESIFDGKLEPTNSPYAVAKLAAIELGNSMRTQYGHKIINLMPTNLYGPNDNFSEKASHVIPGMMRRMHKAKADNLPEFKIWGSGEPKREFLYVDDLSRAIEFLLNSDVDHEILNVGSGEEVRIIELAEMLKNIIEFEGTISKDETMPDGNPKKLIDSSKLIEMGWKPKISLKEGLEKTYDWFNRNKDSLRV